MVICNFCGENFKSGYVRVSAQSNSESGRRLYTTICSLLGGVFPFEEELVVCWAKCGRQRILRLEAELEKVSESKPLNSRTVSYDRRN